MNSATAEYIDQINDYTHIGKPRRSLAPSNRLSPPD